MLAAVLKSPGCLELEDVPDPQCPQGGALLEVSACAVCGTDVKMRQAGHKDLAYPRILGHEIVGRIAEIDRDCGLSEGDLVQVWPGIACGKCRPCQREEDNRCREMKILGFNQDGGFAEFVALPWQCISRGLNLLPKGTDPALAALAEPLACCINGQEMAGVSKGDTVLILGAGPIGGLHALLAELAGAEKIMALEMLPNRILEIKRHTTADVISANGACESSESLEKVVLDETEGAGADVIHDGHSGDPRLQSSFPVARSGRQNLRLLRSEAWELQRADGSSHAALPGTDHHGSIRLFQPPEPESRGAALLW